MLHDISEQLHQNVVHCLARILILKAWNDQFRDLRRRGLNLFKASHAVSLTVRPSSPGRAVGLPSTTSLKRERARNEGATGWSSILNSAFALGASVAKATGPNIDILERSRIPSEAALLNQLRNGPGRQERCLAAATHRRDTQARLHGVRFSRRCVCLPDRGLHE